MSRVLGAPALLLVLLASVLAACTGDPSDDAPVLEVAWSADLDDVWSDQGKLWVATDDLWIVRNPLFDRLSAVRIEDGSIAWQAPVPKICGLSPVNAAGLLVVQSGEKCERIGVLDTATGSPAWTAQVRDPREAYPTEQGTNVGLTEQTVTVPGRCGVERWSVADGTFVGLLADAKAPARRADGACGKPATTGSLALVAGTDGLSAYDADTGDRRWVLAGADAGVERVYATDPLVVDLRIDGVRAVRELDPATGVPGPVLGRTLPGIGRGPDVADPAGDTVVGVYRRSAGPLDATYAAVVRGWDDATGEDRWQRVADGDDYLGSDATGTVLGRSVETDDDGYGYWVLRAEPGSADFRTVGWIDDQVLDAVRVGDLLITGSDFTGETTAFRLPDETVDVPARDSRDRSRKPRTAPGDLRPAPQVDPCAAVSPSTLESLGFERRLELPAPLDCRWTEGERQLSVRVSVAAPTEDRTAVEVATDEVAALRQAFGYADLELGDEAGVRITPAVGTTSFDEVPGTTRTDVALVLRWRNVVIDAGYTDGSGGLGRDQDRLPRAAFRAEQGLRAAAFEALAATGAEDVPGADAPAPAADGPVTRLPDVCRVVRKQVRALLPGVPEHDLTAPGEDRLRGCRWADPGSRRTFVQVLASATGPGALTGDTAVGAAQASYAASTEPARAEPVRGPGWDEAAATGDLGRYGAAQRLTVRAGNVVLVVQFSVHEPPEPVAEDFGRSLARRLTAAIAATP